MRIELGDIQTGLGMLGNVLSIPRQLEAGGIENEQQRLLLKEAGYDEATIAKMAPQPSMRWLSAGQPGFGGKVLGGVGDVGSILTTIVGKPIKAPRMEMSDIAAMTTLRTRNQQAAAKKRLGAVILDPKSTNKDIAAAAIESGDTNEALRLLRPGYGESKMPASIIGLRGYINNLDPGDPRRERAQRTLDDTLAAQREQDEASQRRAQENADRHYLTPAQIEEQRHGQVVKQRGEEADRMNLKGADRDYYMSFGHPRVERQPPAGKTYEQDYAEEQRRRDLLAKDPRTARTIPNEPIEVTVRRNRAARAAGEGAEKAGGDIPSAPPTEADIRKQRRRDAEGAGYKQGSPEYVYFMEHGTAPEKPPESPGLLRRMFGGGGETTTTTTPGSTTTSTTQPPGAALDADTIIGRFTMEDKPPDVQAAVRDATDKGMTGWPLANWLASIDPSILKQPGP